MYRRRGFNKKNFRKSSRRSKRRMGTRIKRYGVSRGGIRL